MKYIASLALLFVLGCSRRELPKPSNETGSAQAPVLTNGNVDAAKEAVALYRTVGDATVMVPVEFTIEKAQPDSDVVLRMPTGGKVRLMTGSTCNASLKVMCRRLRGKIVKDDCVVGSGERLRVADVLYHHIKVEGDVPASVLASWQVPSTAPANLGFYCSAEEIIRNGAESEQSP